MLINEKLPHVSIVVLNWNGWEDTIECLQSLFNINYKNYKIVVVDNGSNDESVKKIHEYAEGIRHTDASSVNYARIYNKISLKEVDRSDNYEICVNNDRYEFVLLKCDKNYGYAIGNNVGIEYAIKVHKSDYVLVLNNDTIVEKNCLTELVKEAEKDRTIGMAGPKTFYYYSPEEFSFAGSFTSRITCDLPNIKEKDSNVFQDVDILSGCCQFFRTSMIEKIGMYDPSYPPGYDNLEICFRAKKYLYKIRYVPAAGIWHKIGKSRIKAEKNPNKYSDQLNYSASLD
jgi:GT2 family glycosyltransferase